MAKLKKPHYSPCMYVQYSGGCAVQRRDTIQPLYLRSTAVLMASFRRTAVLMISLPCTTVQPPLYCSTYAALQSHRCTANSYLG